MGELELKGKKVLGIFSIVYIILTLLSLVNTLTANQLGFITIASIVIQLVSLYAAYQGKAWGKIVLIVLGIITIVLVGISGLLVFTVSAGIGLLLLILGLATPVTTIIVLTVPKSVKAYFAYCNGKTNPTSTDQTEVLEIGNEDTTNSDENL